MKFWSVLLAIVRGVLRAFADDSPWPKAKKAKKKGAKRPTAKPKKEPAPSGPPPDELLWWVTPEPPATEPGSVPEPATAPDAQEPSAPPGPTRPRLVLSAHASRFRTEATPPTINPTITLQTDEGTFVTSASFSGEHVLGVKRTERPRKAGESRRHRRKKPIAQTAEQMAPSQKCAPAGPSTAGEPPSLDLGFTWVDPPDPADAGSAPETEALETEEDSAEQERQDGGQSSGPSDAGSLENSEASPVRDRASQAGHRRMSRAQRRAQRKKRIAAA